MKTFKVEIRKGHESFKGHDLFDTHTYEVQALHVRSAVNKAKKLSEKPFKWGWIDRVTVYHNDKFVCSGPLHLILKHSEKR